MMHYSHTETETSLYIEDGNALLYKIADLPDTFKGIALKVLKLLPRNRDVIFSTDMYHKDSLKNQERQRRGCSQKLLLKGINTRRPADFKSFLLNPENKEQLFELIHRVWTSPDAAPQLQGRFVVFVLHGKCLKLSSQDGESVIEEELAEIFSNQEETDT